MTQRRVRVRPRIPNRSLANAFHQNARSFRASALEMRSSNPHASEHFLAIAIELTLKSYLLRLGVTDDWNRRYLRHDLAKTLRFARRGGLKAHSVALANIAHLLGAPYQSGGFTRSSEALISDRGWEVSTRAVTELFHAVEDADGAGANDDMPVERKR